MAKLSTNDKISNKDTNRLVRFMAKQLISKDPRPGETGITSQWCKKLVAQYPQLGDSGETLNEKTVILSLYLNSKHQYYTAHIRNLFLNPQNIYEKCVVSRKWLMSLQFDNPGLDCSGLT